MPARDEPGRRLALIVASSGYRDPTLQQLRAPGHDASDLAEVLGDPAIGNFDVCTLINEPNDQLQRGIAKFCGEPGPGDLVLVYMSCHGVLDIRGRLYYATVDTERDLLSATSVSAPWLNDRLDECRARRRILLLDCCYSGAFAKGGKGGDSLALREKFSGRGKVVLTASGATEYSFEGTQVVGEGVRSVFTHAVVDGLRTGQADRDGDGLITIDDLYHHVYEAVRAAEPRQTPELWSFGVEGDLLVARTPRGLRIKSSPLPDYARSVTVPIPRLVRSLTGQKGWVNSRVSGVAFSRDGRLLANGGNGAKVRLWDPATGEQRFVLEYAPNWVSNDVADVAFSHDGGLLASAQVKWLVLWDPASGKRRRVLTGHTGLVEGVAFSPDGRLLASGSEDETVRLWDPATGEQRRTLTGHAGPVRTVAFSPDGRLLASGGDDGTVRLWDPATGEQRRTLTGHTGYVWSIAFSPGGRLLASGGKDETVRLWDPATGEQRRTLTGHTGAVWGVAFSPDGRLLASGGEDGTVRLWDPVTGTSQHVLTGQTDVVYCVAFSADGRLLASGGYYGLVRLWDLDPATAGT